MCTLKELQDGTYSIDDVDMMNELLDLKDNMRADANKKGR